jgi:hypothetical protein
MAVRLLLQRLLIFSVMAVPLSGSTAKAEDSSADSSVKQVCVIRDARISESSGLAASQIRPDAFWIHNDSGDSARLFLVSASGETLTVMNLKTEKPVDWEDMCSFVVDGKSWLLIADTGDNLSQRGSKSARRGEPQSACRLLLIREPESLRDQSVAAEIHTEVFQNTELVYEDGPRDCESIAVDTERQEILLISKTLGLESALYRIPLRLRQGHGRATAKRLATTGIPMVTGMDISRDNSRMVIVSLFAGVVIDRRSGESWEDAFKRPAVPLSLPPRKQGETVCFCDSSDEIFVNSEATEQPLWRVKLPEPEKTTSEVSDDQ